MSSVTGRESTSYWKQGAVWGTAVDGGAGMLLMEDGLEIDNALSGVEENNSAWMKDMDLAPSTAAFNYKQNLRYDDIRSMACVLGTADYAAPAEENVGKGDYKHTIYPATQTEGVYATFAQRKKSASTTVVQTANSLKYAGFTLTGNPSPGRFEMAYNTFADTIDNASATITDSDFTSLTIPSGNGGRAFFRNMAFLMNDQSGATLATGDAVSNAITSLEFSYQRSLAADYTNTSGNTIEEPCEDSFGEAIVTLEMRNLDSVLDGYYTDWKAGTTKKFKFTITGAAATTATGTVAAASFIVSAPKAFITNVDYGAYTGPGRLAGKITLQLMGTETTGDSSGMAFLQPFQVEVINAQTAEVIT